jgi:hypothetical protein
LPTNRAAFDLSQSSEEEKADFAKLKSKWESLDNAIDEELKTPVPEINWADWQKKIKDSGNVIGAWKQVCSLLLFEFILFLIFGVCKIDDL